MKGLRKEEATLIDLRPCHEVVVRENIRLVRLVKLVKCVSARFLSAEATSCWPRYPRRNVEFMKQPLMEARFLRANQLDPFNNLRMLTVLL